MDGGESAGVRGAIDGVRQDGRVDPAIPSRPAPAAPGRRRARVGFGLTILGDLLIVVGAFLPWVISGEARRDSFATVRAAQRIGVVDMPIWETLLSVWYLAPLLAALVLVGLAFDRRWLARLGAVPLVVLTLAFGGLVVLGPVPRGAGPVVAVVGAVVLTVGTILGGGRGPDRARTVAPDPTAGGAVPS